MVHALSPLDAAKIDPALRQKYDVRGPRYTSYPPANHFAEVPRPELEARWRARNGLADDPGLSLYLHLPFCAARCLFCACHTFIGHTVEDQGAYLDQLLREMELAAALVDPSRPVHQLAIGGGTPNQLTTSQLRRLLAALHTRFQFAVGAELSVELNPRTATRPKLDAFIDAGFNRFSLGIQDFDAGVLETVRRAQGLMRVQDTVAWLREHGCQSLNFDLIYGLPGQSLQTARATCAQVLELRPERIALYSYAHVPWFQPHQESLAGAGLPDQDLKASLFLQMAAELLEAGYVAIGMDHFALPDDSLALAFASRTLRRNFMGYTTCRGLDLLALGASAISSVGASYAQNAKSLEDYGRGIAEGRLPIFRGFLLSRDDEIRRELLIELFCNFRVDFAALGRQFDIEPASYFAADLEGLQGMVDDGLLRWDARGIEVLPLGRFFIRNICMGFDSYLRQQQGPAVYSRTV